MTGKGYVETVNRFFVPSTLGEAIVNGLRDRFDFMEVHYTRGHGRRAGCHRRRQSRLSAGGRPLRQALDGQLAQFAQVELPRFAGAGTEDSATYPCPDCGDGVLRRLKSKTGIFWGCSNYSRADNPCKATFPDNKGKPGKSESAHYQKYRSPLPGMR